MVIKAGNTFETMNREQFAAIVRATRANKTLRVYGRLSQFGRVLITDDYRLAYPAWTMTPPLNIHR